MKVTDTEIPDIKLIEPRLFPDQRGVFLETWNAQRYKEMLETPPFVQDNFSHSCRGTLRGLHYQVEQVQGKLVHVSRGEVFDVALDIRESSPHFGQWICEYLSGENRKQLWIPPGFAHGFLVISETADLVYKCTDYYLPEAERTIQWDDTALSIDWPLGSIGAPTLSKKDQHGVPFDDAEYYP
ncbi:MAG: dTDP-4-dehydrorhamnose 3,5-epimerase [Pseudomonadota bacterium]